MNVIGAPALPLTDNVTFTPEYTPPRTYTVPPADTTDAALPNDANGDDTEPFPDESDPVVDTYTAPATGDVDGDGDAGGHGEGDGDGTGAEVAVRPSRNDTTGEITRPLAAEPGQARPAVKKPTPVTVIGTSARCHVLRGTNRFRNWALVRVIAVRKRLAELTHGRPGIRARMLRPRPSMILIRMVQLLSRR